MKVCEVCGNEISTRDGDNRCQHCDEPKADKPAVKARKAANRRARDEAMRSIGMTKVRGAMGGTYWE